MFEHSVKVPRHYKVAANIFKQVSTEGGSIKSLLYDEKLRHFRTNVLFALITETIKHAADIDRIFESCSLLQNEPRLDPWLAKVLSAELLYGKKALPSKSKPEQTILSYQEHFEKYQSEHQADLKPEAAPKPRYIRVNTNLLTTSDAIRTFQDEGYRFIRCTSGSYEDYLEQIQNLSEFDFTQDYHVKTVFVFAPGTKLHDHELYLENKIILQNKATAMAVHLLAPPAGSVVLDMCAAPGMKTTQLAAYLRNNGKIYAVERNEKRFETLRSFICKTRSQCVTPIHRDCLEIKRGEYEDVEYILLDPSCSGSGMDFSVHNYIEETRLAKLTSIQEKFLKHAMNAFPKARRIVYSTCSLFPEENERVITNVVKTSRAKWRVQDVKELLKDQWKNFGSGMYGSMGTRCMYARPDSDFTTGFFLAVLDRDPKYFKKGLTNENCTGSGEKPKKKIGKKDIDTSNVSGDYKNKSKTDAVSLNDDVENIDTVKSKKKKKKQEENTGVSEIVESVTISLTDEVKETESKSLKKKRKIIQSEPYVSNIPNTFEELKVNSTDEEVVTKKKKKSESNVSNISHTFEELKLNNTDEQVVTKKKKKKKSQQEYDDDILKNDLEDISNIESERNEKIAKKKQKKHDPNFSTDGIPTDIAIEVSVKKRKNKNYVQDIETGIPTDDVIDSVPEVPKKKKKKKHEENSMEI